jgi:hypothetical protein
MMPVRLLQCICFFTTQQNVGALAVTLSAEECLELEAAVPADQVRAGASGWAGVRACA